MPPITLTVEVPWPKGKLTLSRLERAIHRAARRQEGAHPGPGSLGVPVAPCLGRWALDNAAV